MELLKLKNQICFPLYALSRKVINQYQPFLEKLEITYPQYLVMLLLWENQVQSVKELGTRLMLDSGTLTPLLKRLEEKELVNRTRKKEDERVVLVTLTPKGEKLKEQAADIPAKLACSLKLSDDELIQFRSVIQGMLNTL